MFRPGSHEERPPLTKEKDQSLSFNHLPWKFRAAFESVCWKCVLFWTVQGRVCFLWKSVFTTLSPRCLTTTSTINYKDSDGIGPIDIPVLGVAYIPVQINNRQVSMHFLVADIAGEETQLGHPFPTQGLAHLDFGNHRIVPYFHIPSFLTANPARVSIPVQPVPTECGCYDTVDGYIR